MVVESESRDDARRTKYGPALNDGHRPVLLGTSRDIRAEIYEQRYTSRILPVCTLISGDDHIYVQ